MAIVKGAETQGCDLSSGIYLCQQTELVILLLIQVVGEHKCFHLHAVL